jgi:hypothetical protein
MTCARRCTSVVSVHAEGDWVLYMVGKGDCVCVLVQGSDEGECKVCVYARVLNRAYSALSSVCY